MRHLLLTSTAAIIAIAMPAHAEKVVVHTETHVQAQDIEGVNKINFSAFDTNEDGKYSMKEVGEKLFYVFDTDGNQVIDNMEWDNRSMYTITPMEKETFQFVDYGADGHIDVSTMTYETFYEASGLIRFDENKNGLSASEFIGTGFQELDDNDNNTIEIDEWKEAYLEARIHANAEQERYN